MAPLRRWAGAERRRGEGKRLSWPGPEVGLFGEVLERGCAAAEGRGREGLAVLAAGVAGRCLGHTGLGRGVPQLGGGSSPLGRRSLCSRLGSPEGAGRG